jgi:flagellar motor switch protein FliG
MLSKTSTDLRKLDTSGVQTLLRNVDKDKLAIGLKGASEDLRDLFFSNLSERAGKILREEMDAMGPVRLKDVDEAQMHLVTAAKDLSAKGEIVIADAKGDDELVY